MTTAEKIAKYAATHTTPDQKLCPKLVIHWSGYNKNQGNYNKYYHLWNGSVMTGMFATNDCVKSPSTYGYTGTYIKVISDNILEVAHIRITDGSRGHGEIRSWEYEPSSGYNHLYIPRIFIDKQTLTPYDEKGMELWKDHSKRYYNDFAARYINQLDSYGRINSSAARNEMAKFTGMNQQDLTFACNWAEWYRNAAERPASRLIYNDIELPEESFQIPTITFKIMSEKCAVFRVYTKAPKWSYTNGWDYSDPTCATESYRVFIDDKGKPTVKIKKNSEWVVSSKSLRGWNGIERCRATYALVYHSDPMQFKRLSYLKDVLKFKTTDGGRLLCQIIDMLRHPLAEKLAKCGYEHLTQKTMSDGKIQANSKLLFGLSKIDESLPLAKALKLNNEQLKYLNDNACDRYLHTSYMESVRQLVDNVSSLSLSEFQMYYSGVKRIQSRFDPLRKAIDPNTPRWGRTQDPSLTDEMKKLIIRLIKLEATEGNTGIIDAYIDAVNTYRQINEKPEINWTDFRNRADVVQMHDNLVALLNQQRDTYFRRTNENLQKSFDKLQQERIEKFAYTDGEFSIVVPESLSALTTEGQALHHCVGSYLHSHSTGQTNIVFLRKNSDPETSFYTIEVGVNDNIIQIHGKHNCWLGNNPEAIPFVYEWIKAKKLTCQLNLLLDTACGYSCSGKCLPQSYLYRTRKMEVIA